jgi:hypothetical protein
MPFRSEGPLSLGCILSIQPRHRKKAWTTVVFRGSTARTLSLCKAQKKERSTNVYIATVRTLHITGTAHTRSPNSDATSSHTSFKSKPECAPTLIPGITAIMITISGKHNTPFSQYSTTPWRKRKANTAQGQQHRSLPKPSPLRLLLRRLEHRHVQEYESALRRVLQLLLHRLLRGCRAGVRARRAMKCYPTQVSLIFSIAERTAINRH